MPDIPGNSSTTSTVTVGSTTNGSLETIGDHDWFRITLTAGQEITITLNGLTLEDPYLRIRNAAGTVIFENDDISSGVNRDSKLSFAAPSSGTFYIDVGAFDNNYAGTYQLGVANFIPPSVWNYNQIADQLVNGYWGGDDHHFNVTQGGTITVNITGLTAAGQTLAREALTVWSDIIGVNFAQVASGGQIRFDDNEEGAYSDGNWSGGIISSAHVNVSTQWLANYGTSLNGYSFQTYIHEIGHALGLGHAGNYNSTADYRYDALYANDGWPATIMSYFDQSESTYFGSLGFNKNYVATPMIADILAMSTLYGLSTTTRSGDTSYGSASGWNTSMGAICIFDSAGTDTIDCSGLAGNHLINLDPGTFSNIMGEVGNVSIALGVIIENATGSSGSDTLIGNGANNILTGGAGQDSLTGGSGDDIFRDTAAGLTGDTITDFAAGDRIVISNAALAGFAFSLSGATLTFTGGSLNFGSVPVGQIVAQAAASGGVELSFGASAIPGDARNDFNGDGRSDILWRNDSGAFTDWLGQANGGYVANDANAYHQVQTSWNVAGSGDFNGDGRDDILWRSDSGAVSDWLGQANGGFVANDANAYRQVPTNWHVAGTGDFNGDGRDDILWRSDSGAVSDWLGQANGGFVTNDANALRQVSTSWHVAGTGDFNGDGRDDILWRSDTGALSDWLGTANGGFVTNDANAYRQVPTSWHVAGTGDFNGDGRDDILWRSDTGALSDWLGTANGGFVVNDANAYGQVATNWNVAGTGDFNGDGRDDVIWRNDNGAFTQWLGQSNGGFVSNDVNAGNMVPNSWHVQPDYLLI